MTPQDLYNALKSYWDEQRIAFLNEKTLEMKRVLPTVEAYLAKQETVILNAGDTSDRHPCCNIGAWHKYWQVATANFDNMMHCSCCNKPIFSDVSDAGCANVAQGLDEEGKQDTSEKHQAHGGHIIIDCLGKDNYFITPMCPHCNGQHDKVLPLLNGSIVVKEEMAVVE